MAETVQRVIVEIKDGVAVLSLNHPEVMNALSPALVGEAMTALGGLAADPQIRALILTGRGKAFCAGANLTENQSAPDTGRLLEEVYHPFLRALRDFPHPIITAVNGPAVGIGLSLSLMGDLTLAARSAYFLCGFVRIGLVPDGGATWLLPRLIGLARARAMALLAEPVDAQTALDWGLIHQLSAEASLMADAMTLAQRLANGPASLAATRRLFWNSANNSYEQQLTAEQAAQAHAGQTNDFREGLEAFRHKRPPRFTGK